MSLERTIMSLLEYPEMTVPSHLAEGFSDDWTPRQAGQYLDWVLMMMIVRTDTLLELFGEAGEDADAAAQLARIGSRVAVAVHEKPFSEFREPDPPQWQLPTSAKLPKHIDVDTYRQINRVIDEECNVAGPRLTDHGQALGLDLGLLVARFVMRDRGQFVWWEVEPGRNSSNLPVLRIDVERRKEGIAFGDYFHPTQHAIGLLSEVLLGHQSDDTWQKLYLRVRRLIDENHGIEG